MESDTAQAGHIVVLGSLVSQNQVSATGVTASMANLRKIWSKG
jgi:hypothetical protein